VFIESRLWCAQGEFDMSFFFDVWAHDGFVLASDVRLIEEVDGQQVEPTYIHKIVQSPYWRVGVKCAVAFCGVEPDLCRRYFIEACASKDTFKSIAEQFARKWTEHFAGTSKYSAVHLVGFERHQNSDKSIPQMWYWHNWSDGEGFLTEERLSRDLATFSDPIPANNHLPWKINELTGKFPAMVPEDEFSLAMAFLRLYQPFFTWNGDTTFWRSASETVGSALNLLWRQKTTWTLEEVFQLTKDCLGFLTSVARLLPASTVGISPAGQFDLLTVKPNEIVASMAELPNES
jgi:hypothetical protein